MGSDIDSDALISIAQAEGNNASMSQSAMKR
jgi:hypothetical protein